MPFHPPETVEVKTGDHRVLTVSMSGDEAGWPVFLLHGTPGSRTGPKPRSSVLYRLGVNLICYDRPGYGGSTRQPDRRVADAAADVEAIAREFGINRFSIAGRSGGGPHALACAALLPERVTRTAVLVSLAPSDAPGLDWFSGMGAANRDDFAAADNDTEQFMQQLALRARRAAEDPLILLDLLRTQMTEVDRRVITDVTISRLLADSYTEALKVGPHGWIDDVTALRAQWGFDLSAIPGPVRLWHGVDDNFAPVSHTRWLADQIPDAEMMIQAETAHFGAVEALPSMLGWLGSRDPQ